MTKQQIKAGMAAVDQIRHFIGERQRRAVVELMRGEEGMHFVERMVLLADTISKMPKVYEQDGKGDQALIHLHYFTAGCDWWITERDTTPEQCQAFGFAQLSPGMGELGYISIADVVAAGGELDFYWKPITLEVRARQADKRCEAEPRARWSEFADRFAREHPDLAAAELPQDNPRVNR